MDLKMNKIQVSSIYNKLTFIFIFFAFLLVVVIVYFCLSKAIIYISPVRKNVSTDFIAPVKNLSEGQNMLDGQISGFVTQKIVESQKEFSATGEKTVENEDEIIGVVTIYNKYSKDQPLVKTTRLLSDNDILLRINKTVTVPAGGSVDVGVYLDDPESLEGKSIEPTRFTIPGLWEGLWDKIYAENAEIMSLEGQKVNYVTADDLKNAQAQLKDELYNQVLDEVLASQVKEKVTVLASKEVVQTVTEKEEGQIGNDFKLALRLKVNVIVFNQDDMLKQIEENLKKNVENGHELVSIDLDSIEYSIEKVDLTEEIGYVKVKALGKAIIKIESGLLDKDRLSGKHQEELRKELMNNDSIQEVSIKFKPQWMSRTPFIKNHISVIIER